MAGAATVKGESGKVDRPNIRGSSEAATQHAALPTNAESPPTYQETVDQRGFHRENGGADTYAAPPRVYDRILAWI
jgi:hypothetical protein